jgi:hypothetical protein
MFISNQDKIVLDFHIEPLIDEGSRNKGGSRPDAASYGISGCLGGNVLNSMCLTPKLLMFLVGGFRNSRRRQAGTCGSLTGPQML